MHEQLRLPLRRGWGGWRKGAGRRPAERRRWVSRRKREEFAARYPVHVTVKLAPQLPSLRTAPAFQVVRGILRETNAAGDIRVVHFSVQCDHVHLLVESAGKHALAAGMKSFNTKLARRLNRLWSRTGRLLRDRYHSRILRTPTEVRRAIRYVLQNGRHHGTCKHGHDPYSNAGAFDGWHGQELGPVTRNRRRAREHRLGRQVDALVPETWLLGVGWRRAGPPLPA